MENMKKMIVKYRDKELYGFNCARQYYIQRTSIITYV